MLMNMGVWDMNIEYGNDGTFGIMSYMTDGLYWFSKDQNQRRLWSLGSYIGEYFRDRAKKRKESPSFSDLIY